MTLVVNTEETCSMDNYEYTLVTRHSELDSSLHINNANYLRYLEEARVSMMKDQNFPIEEVHRANVEMILYKYVCLFKQQVRYPENLIVRSKQIQTKKIRGVLRQEIYRENNSLCFQADAYWAYHAKEKSSSDAAVEFTKRFGQNPRDNILPLAYEKPFVVNPSMPHNVYSFEVRPYELDSFLHVNNAVYANYFELGRWSFRRSILPDLDYFRKENLTFVLYKSVIEFIRPSFLFEELFVKTWLIKLTPLRIIYWQEIQNKDGLIHASCQSEGCVVNNRGIPTKLAPETIRAYDSMIIR